MLWILLLILGLVALAISYYAPLTYPSKRIARIIAGVLLLLALIFFVFWVIPQVSTDNDYHDDNVDVDTVSYQIGV
jgi:energy-coupling factor transporter transmembrane protein EcfT